MTDALAAFVADPEKVQEFLALETVNAQMSNPNTWFADHHPEVSAKWLALLADREAQLAAANQQVGALRGSLSSTFKTTQHHQRLRVAAETTLAAVTALAEEHFHGDDYVDGCFTGDCPHDESAACRDHLANEYKILALNLGRLVQRATPTTPTTTTPETEPMMKTKENKPTRIRPVQALTLDAVAAELARARIKFPRNRRLLVALVEEVGELAKALLQRRDRDEVEREALQVAAVALRIVEEGDADFDNVSDEEAQA